MNDSLSEVLKKASLSNEKIVHLYKKGQINSYSYQEIYERSKKIASLLLSYNLQSKDNVVIILPTSIYFYDAFFGVTMGAGVPSALYPPVRLGRIDEWKETTINQINEINAKIVITLKAITLLLKENSNFQDISFINIDTLDINKIEMKNLPIPLSNNDPAFIQFSSGTTGKSKPITISHTNVITNIEAILEKFPMPHNELSAVSWLPLYHDMGLVGTFLSALYTLDRPLTLIPPEEFIGNPIIWPKLLSETKSTITVAPNFAFGVLTDKLNLEILQKEKIDLSHLKVILCGAEPIHPDTLNHFLDLFKNVNLDEAAMTPVYGMAEATLAISFSDVKKRYQYHYFDREGLSKEKEGIVFKGNDLKYAVPLVSLGKPIKDIELDIWDENDIPVIGKAIGEVVIRGKSITNSVIKHNDSWLKTGDLGFIYEGDLYLSGRIKDIIIVNGRKYDPFYFEKSITNIKGLRNGIAVAFGVFSEQKNSEEIILLCEYRKKDSIPDSTLLLKEINSKITPPIAKIEILPPGTILRTSSGKLRRQASKDLYLKNELNTPKNVSKVNFLFKHALRSLKNRLNKY